MRQSRLRLARLLLLLVWTITGLFGIVELVTAQAYESEGYASWYAGKFHGRLTASGEVFDTGELTAAHKTLAFGTIVEVRHLANGRTVEVRINDRGPFVEGRIIDLSRAAAERLAMVAEGVARVRLTVVFVPEPPTHRIQVASFSSATSAALTRDRIRSSGIPAEIEETEHAHRVVVPRISEDDLDEMVSRLDAMGYRSLLVRTEKVSSPRRPAEAAE